MRWVTINKAQELTGLPASFFQEHIGKTSRAWPEGKIWKLFEDRQLIDLQALYDLIDRVPGATTTQIRRTVADSVGTSAPTPAPDASTAPTFSGPRFLRLPDVVRMTSLGRTAIYELMATEGFPKRVALSQKAVAWREEEVREWMQTRPTIADAKPLDKR